MSLPLSLKLFLGLCVFFGGFWAVIYVYVITIEIIEPDADIYGLRLNSRVLLEDGVYNFKYSQAGNYLSLDSGAIIVSNKRIVSIFGEKKLSPIWEQGLEQCMYDLKRKFKDYQVKITSENQKQLFGVVSYNLKPTKHYLNGECIVNESNNDILMTLYLGDDTHKYKGDNSKQLPDELYSKLSNPSIWVESDKDISVELSEFNGQLNVDNYRFLDLNLNTKFDDFKRSTAVNVDGNKLYLVKTFGYENNYTKPSDLKKMELNNNILSEFRTRGLDEDIRNENARLWIQPSKTHVFLDKNDNIKTIYALEYSKGISECQDKLEKYAVYLLHRHSMEYKFTLFKNSYMLEKSQFKAVDKINNVSIELTCYHKNVDYMSIEFIKY